MKLKTSIIVLCIIMIAIVSATMIVFALSKLSKLQEPKRFERMPHICFTTLVIEGDSMDVLINYDMYFTLTKKATYDSWIEEHRELNLQANEIIDVIVNGVVRTSGIKDLRWSIDVEIKAKMNSAFQDTKHGSRLDSLIVQRVAVIDCYYK